MAVRSTDGNSLFFVNTLNKGLKKGSLDAVKTLTSMASQISKINPFGALVGKATDAFITITAQAYQMSRNFEHAMKEVETISEATQKNFDGISEKVFSISKISPNAPEQLAKAYYQIVSAGYDGAEGLKLLEVSAKSAVAGVTNTATAVNGITAVLNAFKIDVSESSHVADALFNTVKLGKTTFSELAASISNVAPIAASSKIPLNEILAAIASLTKQGVPTAQAMTQIREAIVGLNKSGRLDGTKTFQENMQSLYNTFKGNQTAIQNEVGSVEALQAILAVSGKNAKEAGKDLLAYNDTVGITEKLFKGMVSSNVNEWIILQNKIKATTKDIGDAVLEMSSGIAKIMNSAFEETKTLKEEVSKQASEYQILKNTVLDVNTEFDKKLEILRQLKSDYPEYLSSLDLDKIKNENLEETLQKVKGTLEEINKLHERRLELSGYEDAANSAKKQQETYKDLYESNLSEFHVAAKKASDFAKENGIVLNYSLSDSPQSIYDEIYKAFITEENDGLFSALFGKKNRIVAELFHINKSVSVFKRELGNATKEVEKENEELRKQRVLIRDNEDGYKDVVNEIQKINSLSNLERYDEDYSFLKIKEAIEQRKSILETIDEIKGITKEDLKTNPNALSEYLKSENDEIAKYAQERFDLLNKKYTPLGGDGEKNNTYEDELNKRKEQYELYQKYINKLTKESADERFATLLKEGKDYGTYLQNELKKFSEHQSKKDAIVNAASSSGVRLIPNAKVTTVNSLKPKSVVTDMKISASSADSIERQLKDLQDKIGASEEENYEVLTKELDEYKSKWIRAYKSYWKERLGEAKKGSKEEAKAKENIKNANKALSGNFEEFAGKISVALNDVATVFRKFGDEDTAKLLEQLSGVTKGIGQLATGISLGDPFSIIGGVSKIIDSAVSVEVVSDTAKFEKGIKELEKSIEELDYAISKSVGTDKITNRIEGIEKQRELQEDLEKAKQAELNARKEVKLLGWRVGKKGKGSGTDPAKIEELEAKMEDATRKAEELKNQLDELYTGTTQTTIVDSIISGLKEGKRSIADFADDFKDLMQNAMLQAFKLKYLDDEVDKFYDAFADAGEDSKFTAEEIASLRNLYAAMISGAQNDLDAINKILEDTGIGALGNETDNRTGLSGAISTITEDTANILAGTLNSIRIDVAGGVEIAQQSSNYLAQIVQNTSYNRYLEGMNVRLQNIETLLS